jgi:hypothetical protein
MVSCSYHDASRTSISSTFAPGLRVRGIEHRLASRKHWQASRRSHYTDAVGTPKPAQGFGQGIINAGLRCVEMSQQGKAKAGQDCRAWMPLLGAEVRATRGLPTTASGALTRLLCLHALHNP